MTNTFITDIKYSFNSTTKVLTIDVTKIDVLTQVNFQSVFEVQGAPYHVVTTYDLSAVVL